MDNIEPTLGLPNLHNEEFSNIKFLWSNELRKAIEEVKIVRVPLIEHLMYSKSAHMIFAPDGVGKSTVALQMMMQSTVDNARVFGEFHVPRALRILNLQGERDESENLERLKTMLGRTGFNPDNFVNTTALQGLDICQKSDYLKALKIIDYILKETFLLPDIINIDPAYAILGNDMISNKDIAPLANFSRTLQNLYGCTIHIVHHANRGARDKTGKRGNEDMFGSRFLSAHFTGIYKLEKSGSDDSGTTMTLDKASQKNLEKKIELAFDVESQLSWYKYPSGLVSKKDKLYAFFKAQKAQDKAFTYDDMMVASSMSQGTLRNMSSLHDKNELVLVGKSTEGKNLYKYTVV